MKQDTRGAMIAAALALGLYGLTLAPGITWGDSAKLVLLTLPLDPGIQPGEHHLRNLLGALFNFLPVGDPAWRQNLFSAVCAAAAVGMAYALCFRWTRSAWAAATAAAALAVSHTFWHLAVIAESYSLAVMLFAGQVWVALDWEETGEWRRLRGFALLTGLALANHVLTLVLGIPFAVFFAVTWLRRRPPAPGWVEAARWVGLFLLGYSPVLYAILRHAPEQGLWESIAGVLDLEATQYLKAGAGLTLGSVLKRSLVIAAQAPGWGGILALWGIVAARRERRAWLLLGGSTVVCLWLFVSLHLDQRTVYRLTPAYFCLALFAGLGAAELEKRVGRHGRLASLGLVLLLPPLAYGIAPALVRAWGVEVGPVQPLREMTYRDSMRYFLVPWKCGDDAPERFARAALAAAGPDGVLVADFTPLMVLTYAQKESGAGRGVELVNLESDRVCRRGMKTLAEEVRARGKRLFAADVQAAYGLEGCRTVAAGVVWEVFPP